MKRFSKTSLIAGGSFAVAAVLIALLVVAIGRREGDRDLGPAVAATPAVATAPASTSAAPPGADQGFLYGRVTDVDGGTYEGRLRFGGEEEAFWTDAFGGFKADSPWAEHVPREQLVERYPIEIFGMVIARREREVELERPFMARLGDIARIEARALHIRVTLKSGTAFELARFSADDLADGLRVWDAEQGVVDLGERSIRSIELLPTPRLDTVPNRLYGTVHTGQGDFTGFVRWNWDKSMGSDVLIGREGAEEIAVPFDTIRSIARVADGSDDGVRLTMADGREFELSGTRDVGPGNRGIGVEDDRYGRVLIGWGAFERVDFGAGGEGDAGGEPDRRGAGGGGTGASGPAYGDFPPGGPLTGTVVTRDGRRLTGRLVYDLDESETTETLDAPAGGVDYSIPFGLIASIVMEDGPTDGAVDGGASGEAGAGRPVVVSLHGGAALRLERLGDLGDGNPGVLVFEDGGEGDGAVFVPWGEVARVDLDRPPAMYPPMEGMGDGG